jgi:F-type H+-transporting ATPase subunit a
LGYQFTFTKFMVLELAVAILMLAVFIPLARRVAGGRPARGRLWNLFEMVLVFIRDEMARPAIGRHDADRFLPYLWTAFFFVLLCNLMGLVPWAGSPTGALAVTGTLAVVAFCMSIGAGMLRLGAAGYFAGQVPHMDLPLVLAAFLKPMILGIEVVGVCIKHGVLSVRLLANMFAGHLVLAVILGFIAATAQSWLWYGVMPASVLGALALNFLELLVAFLQAYIFTFLSALFIGMAMHPH